MERPVRSYLGPAVRRATVRRSAALHPEAMAVAAVALRPTAVRVGPSWLVAVRRASQALPVPWVQRAEAERLKEAAARASVPQAAEAAVLSGLPLEAAARASALQAAEAPSELPSAAEAGRSWAAVAARPFAAAARPSAVAWPSLAFPFLFPARFVVPSPSARIAHAMRRRRIASQSEWSWQAAPGVVFSWRSRSPDQV